VVRRMTIGFVRCFWPDCARKRVLADRSYDADWIRAFVNRRALGPTYPRAEAMKSMPRKLSAS
jgi:hypothetical protein